MVFLVGDGRWSFDEAYASAQDGDTIEFIRNYHHVLPSDKQLVVSKSLKFVGHCEKNDQGGNTFSNGIDAKILINNGAEVTFEKLWCSKVAKGNMFQVMEGSKLHLFNTVIEKEEDDHVICSIYVAEESMLHLNNTELRRCTSGQGIILERKSIANIENCDYLNCKLQIDHSEVVIENSRIRFHNGNVLCVENNSKATLNNSMVISDVPVEAETRWPAIWVDNSELETKGCQVIYDRFINAISINDRSIFSSSNDKIASVSLWDSTAYFDNTSIDYILQANEKAHVVCKNKLCFQGCFHEKIDLYVGQSSTFIAENVEVTRVCNPNFRVADQSFLFIDSLAYPNGDVKAVAFAADETSKYINGNSGYQRGSNTVVDNSDSSEKKEDALQELYSLIGLRQVKKAIEVMINQVTINRKRVEQGLKPLQQNLNAVFVGNPGTGKTTVARLLGKVLFQQGVLSGNDFKFVEVSEPDLISQIVGATAIQTKEYLEKARGGILFIDEAYTLNKKGGSINYGQEAIDTIMKYMEDYRDEIMVIFAGYTKEMDQFLKTNPGLASRTPNRFVFEDFTGEEIVELGELLLTKDQFVLADREYYAKQVAKAYENTMDKSNGRWIRNFNEKIVKEQSSRIVVTNDDEILKITNEDIDKVLKQGQFEETGHSKEAIEELHSLIGISNVKRQIQEFIYQVEANRKKEEVGIKVGDYTLHSLFLGNPGTGKTTVARIVGRILYQKGIIATNKFIEVSRSDLVAGYVGQTSIKTREVLESALGGVLFIDEAYSLYNESGSDYGKEAIEEILKFMEDHRRDIVIIFAGYTKEMSEFLQINSGLKSRIPTIFEFEDYSPEEIVQIGLLGLKEYRFDEEYYRVIVQNEYRNTNDYSNGRWIRNFNEKLLRIQAARLIQSCDDGFDIISNEDIREASMR